MNLPPDTSFLHGYALGAGVGLIIAVAILCAAL